MLVIQLSYSDSGMPVKSYHYFSRESVLGFLRERCLWLRERTKHAARESVQRSVMFTSFTDKTHPKRRYYIFSFNLKLYLLTLALENLYFNTLDRERAACGSRAAGYRPLCYHPVSTTHLPQYYYTTTPANQMKADYNNVLQKPRRYLYQLILRIIMLFVKVIDTIIKSEFR